MKNAMTETIYEAVQRELDNYINENGLNDEYAPLRVWIGNLKFYNEGYLVGAWISLPMYDDELSRIYDIISLDGEIETYIGDYESECGIKVGEYDDIFEWNKELGQIDFDEWDMEMTDILLNNGFTFDEIENAWRNGAIVPYPNCWNMKEVAEEIVDQTGMLRGIPEEVTRYFDYKQYGYDLETTGSFFRYSGGIFEIN